MTAAAEPAHDDDFRPLEPWQIVQADEAAMSGEDWHGQARAARCHVNKIIRHRKAELARKPSPKQAAQRRRYFHGRGA